MKTHILIEQFNDGDEEMRKDLIGYLLSHEWGYRVLLEEDD